MQERTPEQLVPEESDSRNAAYEGEDEECRPEGCDVQAFRGDSPVHAQGPRPYPGRALGQTMFSASILCHTWPPFSVIP